VTIVQDSFCTDERIYLFLNFLFQISADSIEAKKPSSLHDQIITREGDSPLHYSGAPNVFKSGPY
jgi:hypothetical protein